MEDASNGETFEIRASAALFTDEELSANVDGLAGDIGLRQVAGKVSRNTTAWGAACGLGFGVLGVETRMFHRPSGLHPLRCTPRLSKELKELI